MTTLINIANVADKITLKADRRKKPLVNTHGKILVDEVLRVLFLTDYLDTADKKILESKIYKHFEIEYDGAKHL